jgi:glutamate-ammonia-ligase adenylyltransferase
MTIKNYWPDLEKELSGTPPDLEERLEILRRYRKSSIRAIQARDLAGEFPLTLLFEELTALAEAVLRGGYEISTAELKKRFPEPAGAFAVIAMGKFGGRELTYGSDLDLIYLFERQEDGEYYARLGERIITSLTLLTREGYAYRIDTALRPSGNAGTLVSTLEAFREYHQKMGRTWERQALIKARPILGDPSFLRQAAESFDAISYTAYDPKKVAREIDHLRTRMENELARERPGRYNLKTGRGGIVDIEFVVQYLQLIHGRANPSIRRQNTVEAIRALDREGFLAVAKRLEKSYLFYREIETRLRLVLEHPTDELIEGADWMERLEGRFFKGRSLLKEYLETREEVRAAYERILKV